MLAQPIVRSLEFAWRGMRAAVAAIGRVFEILMNTVLAVASVVFLCGVVYFFARSAWEQPLATTMLLSGFGVVMWVWPKVQGCESESNEASGRHLLQFCGACLVACCVIESLKSSSITLATCGAVGLGILLLSREKNVTREPGR